MQSQISASRIVPSADLITLLASRFHLPHNNSSTKSFLQWYHVDAWPYDFSLLLSSLLAVVTIALRSQRRYAVLLFIHISLLVAVSVAFWGPAIRYLQPISFMTRLVIALWTQALSTNRRVKDEAMTNEQRISVQSNPTLRSDVSGLAQPAFIGS
jgi:hypothetical protein